MKYIILFYIALFLNNTSYFETNGVVNASVYLIYGYVISGGLKYLKKVMD